MIRAGWDVELAFSVGMGNAMAQVNPMLYLAKDVPHTLINRAGAAYPLDIFTVDGTAIEEHLTGYMGPISNYTTFTPIKAVHELGVLRWVSSARLVRVARLRFKWLNN